MIATERQHISGAMIVEKPSRPIFSVIHCGIYVKFNNLAHIVNLLS